MSNNAPDYENNLVFEPKSADDLNKQERQSDVLITAIERCEKLEKEIIALKKEYQAECNRADELEDSLHISWQNESKLKELLKECKPYVTRNVVFTTVNRAEVVDLEKNELLTKIDNAIGDNR